MLENYEDVTHYPLDADVREELLRSQNECSFVWGTSEHWPVGVVMSFVWRDGRFWLTASSQRARIHAIRRDPRVAIIVSSVGTPLGPARSATAKGRVALRSDRETKDWFYPALSAAILPGNEPLQRGFARMLDSPRRVILEVTPEKWITYDGTKLMAASREAFAASE